MDNNNFHNSRTHKSSGTLPLLPSCFVVCVLSLLEPRVAVDPFQESFASFNAFSEKAALWSVKLGMTFETHPQTIKPFDAGLATGVTNDLLALVGANLRAEERAALSHGLCAIATEGAHFWLPHPLELL